MKNKKEAVPPSIVKADIIEGHDRYDDVLYEYTPNQVEKHQQDGQKFLFHAKNAVVLSVEVLSDTMLRFRYAARGIFERDFSYAIDPNYQAADVNTLLEEKEKHFLIKTEVLNCVIRKEDLKVEIRNKQNKIISADASGYLAEATLQKGTRKVSISKKMQADEYFFGLGDKSCSLNLKGKKLENYATDAFAYGADTDPLYRAIPFYYGLHNGLAYGIFFDNSYRSHFDFNSIGSGETSFYADGGEMNYYFIYGPQLQSVAQEFAALTGKAELPPIWALGFHQCRWSYYPESRVRDLAAEFRKRQIPCDAIYLDIDYMDGYRCFTVNKEYFPDLKKMIADLIADGFHTVVMIDPGIRVDDEYSVFTSGMEQDVFCRRLSGELMTGPVWPPECVWPDYTRAHVRSWWGELYRGLYEEDGVSGFWNDMNEPAVFKLNIKTFPDGVRHHFEGFPTGHARIHNVYGSQMIRATYQGLKNIKPNKRPLVITRASYAGGQRFASSWTGDNCATWEHLKIANRQCQRMSISGFSFIGTDIGGFVDQPSGELMVRWLQLGIFHPLYRVHSMGNNTDGADEVNTEEVKAAERDNRLDQEPWVFGESYTPQAKAAIELRYQLLPYLYTVFRNYTLDGAPVIRPVSFYDQTDVNTLLDETTFMYGDQLLVHPITDKGTTIEKIYLPFGKWYYYWSGQALIGQQTVMVLCQLSQIPIFVKAGAVIPHYPVRQSTSEKVAMLQLKSFYGEGTHHSELYEDAGDGYAYENGNYRLLKITQVGTDTSFEINFEEEGSYTPEYENCTLEILGLPFEVKACRVDGVEKNFRVEVRDGNRVCLLEYDSGFGKILIS